MNSFRLQYYNSFPSKLYQYLDGNLLDEIRVIKMKDTIYVTPRIDISNDLPVREWTIEMYHSFKTKIDSYNYIIDKELYFIPVAVYEMDPLDDILKVIEEYPMFGKELSYGHQCVLVSYQKKFYYYDPQSYSIEFHALKQYFPQLQFVGDNVQVNDDYCLLHTINFMMKVWKNPKRLFKKKKGNKDVHKRLSKICKFLI